MVKQKRLKIKLLWHKKRFDTGIGLTNYLKYFIAFFALASKDLYYTVYISIAYAFICYAMGYYWIKYKWADAENEVNNLLNPFTRHVIKKLK